MKRTYQNTETTTMADATTHNRLNGSTVSRTHKPPQRIKDRSMAPNPSGGGSIPKREKWEWGEPGEPGEFMWLDVTELWIDPAYQRDITSEARVVKIAREFKHYAFGVLLVCERPDGRKMVFDGQHRGLAAALRDDVRMVPCMVWRWDDVSEEARAFIIGNTHHKMASPFSRQHAGVLSGDDVAVAAQLIMEEIGYRFTKDFGSARSCNAVATIQSMVRKDPDLAREVMILAAEIADGAAIRSRLIKGLEWVARRDPSVFDAVHRERLVELGPDVVEAEMQRHSLLSNKGGARIYGHALVTMLNKGRRSNRIDVDA